MTSFPKDGYLISGIPARRRAVLAVERLKNWSPLQAAFINDKE
jgi:hypothetical protein